MRPISDAIEVHKNIENGQILQFLYLNRLTGFAATETNTSRLLEKALLNPAPH